MAAGSAINTTLGTHTFTVQGNINDNGIHPVKTGGGSHPSVTRFKAKIESGQHRAMFTFKASGASGFQCALLKAPKQHHKKPRAAFSSCRSPKTYKHLTKGKYTFEVRTIGSGGPGSPKSRSFAIA